MNLSPDSVPVSDIARLIELIASHPRNSQSLALPFGADDFTIQPQTEPERLGRSLDSVYGTYYTGSASVIAAAYGLRVILMHLLHNGQSLAAPDSNGVTPIAIAILEGQYDTASWLLPHSESLMACLGDKRKINLLSFLMIKGKIGSHQYQEYSVLLKNIIGQ